MSVRKLGALHRLMSEGHRGGMAKIDALVALSQTEVLVALERGPEGRFRTLLSSRGDHGLPMFTTRKALELGARRYGWHEPSGELRASCVPAKEALRYAAKSRLHYIVVDISSPQELEIEESEVEPLLSERAQRDSMGPFGAIVRLSRSSLLPPLSSGPAPSQSQIPKIKPPSLRAPPVDIVAATQGDGRPRDPFADAAPEVERVTFGSGGDTMSIDALPDHPAEDLTVALSTTMKKFPEVEWATLFMSARGPAQSRPTLGLRIDLGFRVRIAEILAAARSAAESAGAALDTVLLDDVELMRQARSVGIVVYPWRRHR